MLIVLVLLTLSGQRFGLLRSSCFYLNRRSTSATGSSRLLRPSSWGCCGGRSSSWMTVVRHSRAGCWIQGAGLGSRFPWAALHVGFRSCCKFDWYSGAALNILLRPRPFGERERLRWLQITRCRSTYSHTPASDLIHELPCQHFDPKPVAFQLSNLKVSRFYRARYRLWALWCALVWAI